MIRSTRYHFSALPLTVSGNIPVARVSGAVDWNIDGDKPRIYALYLRGENNVFVEVDMTNDAITDVLKEALHNLAKSLHNQRGETEEIPLADPAELGRNALDNAQPEGAQKSSS